MQDKKVIQIYINNFRRHLAAYLKSGIGLSCKVYPARQGGAILEFTIGPDISNEDTYLLPTETVNEALRNIPQSMFGGNLDALRFSGTNISMEPNRIVFIKGDDKQSLWDDQGAQDDVRRIVGVSRGRHK